MELLLTCNGEMYQTHWNSDHESWDREYIKRDTELRYLSIPITLEEGFTLRSYFKIILNYPYLQKLEPFFPDFIKEYKACPKENCLCDDIQHLELNYIASYECDKTIEFDETLFGEKTHDVESHVDIFIDFFGLGTDNETHWGLDFINLNELLDHKVKLGKAKVSIEKSGNFKDYDSLLDKFMVRESDNCHYSLFDLIHTVIFELSFYGDETNKEKVFDDIKKTVAKLEESDDDEKRN